MSLTKSQFSNLKSGDLLLFKSGAVRTVIEGGRDLVEKRGPWNPSVTFTKLNSSQYHRATTVYFFNDIRYKVARIIGNLHGKICTKSELQRLRDIGFDLRVELQLRASEELREAKRRGWKVCKSLVRFAKGKM